MVCLLVLTGGGTWYWKVKTAKLVVPGGGVKYEHYSPWFDYRFDALAKREWPVSTVDFEKGCGYGVDPNLYHCKFYYWVEGKRVSGMMTKPTGMGVFPVVVMLRGYTDKEGYYSGSGTQKVADELAKKGIITLAPDFLGYAESDPESEDMLTARFEKPAIVLTLLASLVNIPQADFSRVGMWGHSNGGQIALSVLEISGRAMPTVVWAPVSLAFPECVTVYSDGLDDGGEAVTNAIAEFEAKEDSRFFSLDWWWARVRAPVLVVQGTVDEWVQLEWSQALVENLRNTGVKADLVVFAGADHNLKPKWSEAVGETLEFLQSAL